VEEGARFVAGWEGTAGQALALQQEPAGARLVIAADSLTTASRLAARLGADLARTPIEAELAIERRRRAARALVLASEARDVFAFVRELAGTDEESDRALIEEVARMKTAAIPVDPGAATASVCAAAENVERAQAALDRAEDARRGALEEINRATRQGARRIDGIDSDRAAALSAEFSVAARAVTAAQDALGRRPALWTEDLRDIRRAARTLRRAEMRVDTMWRSTVRRLLQGAGAGLVLGAFSMEPRLDASGLASIVLAPVALAALWSVRSASLAHTRRDAARRAGAAVTARLFPELANDSVDGSVPVDPLTVWDTRIAAWDARAETLAAAERRLIDAQQAWMAIAGSVDPEQFDRLLVARRELTDAEIRHANAAAAVDRAKQARAKALQAWQQALADNGLAARRPEQLPTALHELEALDARRGLAAERLRQLPGAERRERTRRHLAAILAGRTAKELAAAAEVARHGTRPETLARPLVLADPLAALPRTRWPALRDQLTDLAGTTCVLVTSEPEANTWGFPPLAD